MSDVKTATHQKNLKSKTLAIGIHALVQIITGKSKSSLIELCACERCRDV